MIEWNKYFLGKGEAGASELSKDQDYEEHAEAMGGYGVTSAYASREDFFKTFFTGFQMGRLEIYDRLIRGWIDREGTLLSVGSGRGANEARLLEDGYRVVASDMGELPSLEAMKKLFPKFEFQVMDILGESAPQPYDSVMSLSLIYLFDDRQLDVFFENISFSLKKGGTFILDCAGSPDNRLAWWVHEGLLKMEVLGAWCLMKVLKPSEKMEVVRKHHGYRRNDREIIERAKAHGLEYVEKKEDGFLFEFSRSRLLFPLTKIPVIRDILSFLGKPIPYIRLMKFTKTPGLSRGKDVPL